MKRRFHLTLPERLSEEPVIYTIGKRFDVVTNIRRANVEERQAWVIVELEGPDDAVRAAVDWLADQGVGVDRIDQGAQG